MFFGRYTLLRNRDALELCATKRSIAYALMMAKSRNKQVSIVAAY